jgi:pimeloyl-ACP methyl ester carboxylesterase
LEFITSGTIGNPTILLIHPSKCNGHCFEFLFPFLAGYYLICPTLNGHQLSDNSVYESKEKEVDTISAYLKKTHINTLFAVLGASLGAQVAYELAIRDEFEIGHLYLDGAPFHHMNTLITSIAIQSQIAMGKKCRKKPDGKFLVDTMYPQLASMMKTITAHYDERTIQNMMNEIGLTLGPCVDTDKVTFLYGDKDPYRNTISDIQKSGFHCSVVIKQGYGHLQYLLQNPQEYAQILTKRQAKPC